MARSSWKFLFVSALTSDNHIIERNGVITERWVGQEIHISKGRGYITRIIRSSMIGYKWGSLAPTRVRHKFSLKKEKR